MAPVLVYKRIFHFVRKNEQTLAGRKSVELVISHALSWYMTHKVQVAQTARGGLTTDMDTQQEVLAVVNARPAQQHLDSQFARAALEGEIASPNAITRRQESSLTS